MIPPSDRHPVRHTEAFGFDEPEVRREPRLGWSIYITVLLCLAVAATLPFLV